MSTKAWWNQVLAERKASALKPEKNLMEKLQLEDAGKTPFDLFIGVCMLLFLVGTPVCMFTALVWKPQVKIEQKQPQLQQSTQQKIQLQKERKK